MSSSFSSGECSGHGKTSRVYEGWLYHIGVNSLGYQFCRARYLRINGIFAELFKSNPNQAPAKPIRKGIIGQYFMIEELGRQIFHGRALYAFRISSRVDCNKQGKLACGSAEEVEKWISAFKSAKEEAGCDIGLGNKQKLIYAKQEFNFKGRRYKTPSYLKVNCGNSITIGEGPESVLRRPSSMLAHDPDDAEDYYKHREGDAIEQEKWRCVMTLNGLVIFEDISDTKIKKGSFFMKSVGLVEATPDSIFDMIMTLDKNQRQQWDNVTGDLELVEEIDGHSDIVHGIYDPKFHKRWCFKKDFLFLRRWRRDQDGSYSITEDVAIHKQYPQTFLSLYRIELNPTVWEITPLRPRNCGTPRSLVSQIMEVKSKRWRFWRKLFYAGFQSSTAFHLLCRTAGLKEFFSTSYNDQNGMLEEVYPSVLVSKEKGNRLPPTPEQDEPIEMSEQFYDAITTEDPHEDDESDEEDKQCRLLPKVHSQRNTTWSIRLGLPSRRPPNREANQELVLAALPLQFNSSLLKSSLQKGYGDDDSNSWTDLGGDGFMVRGSTYFKDCIKVPGGDPLFQLLGVDWLKSEKKIEIAAHHQSSLVKSEEAKKLPFILVFNLQLPANPNYSLVFYFAADRPLRPESLLHRFVTGDDNFRNARLKLIPRIVEGYWVIKRAVGTKACLLGRALTCKYIQEDNFLEIDVDVGSSSVARSVCGLVLGYAASVVIDFAILIEGQDEAELPEYLLGVGRINRINPDSAAPFKES